MTNHAMLLRANLKQLKLPTMRAEFDETGSRGGGRRTRTTSSTCCG